MEISLPSVMLTFMSPLVVIRSLNVFVQLFIEKIPYFIASSDC